MGRGAVQECRADVRRARSAPFRKTPSATVPSSAAPPCPSQGRSPYPCGAGRVQRIGGNADMKQFVVASVLAIALATPAFAAEKYFVTVDTVGNCSVVEGGATGLSAGKTALGETGGYDSMADAEKCSERDAQGHIQVQGCRRVSSSRWGVRGSARAPHWARHSISSRARSESRNSGQRPVFVRSGACRPPRMTR